MGYAAAQTLFLFTVLLIVSLVSFAFWTVKRWAVVKKSRPSSDTLAEASAGKSALANNGNYIRWR